MAIEVKLSDYKCAHGGRDDNGDCDRESVVLAVVVVALFLLLLVLCSCCCCCFC